MTRRVLKSPSEQAGALLVRLSVFHMNINHLFHLGKEDKNNMMCLKSGGGGWLVGKDVCVCAQYVCPIVFVSSTFTLTPHKIGLGCSIWMDTPI